MKLQYQFYIFPPLSPAPKRRGWIRRRNAKVIECYLRIGRKLHEWVLIHD